MGVISAYISDDEVVSSLRRQFDRDEQYRIDFYHALHTARFSKDGVLVDVMDRTFLLDANLGFVVREVTNL